MVSCNPLAQLSNYFLKQSSYKNWKERIQKIPLSSSFINSSIKLIEEFQIEKTREREKCHKSKKFNARNWCALKKHVVCTFLAHTLKLMTERGVKEWCHLVGCEIAFRPIVPPYVLLMTRKKRYTWTIKSYHSDGRRSLAEEVTWFLPGEQEIIISIYEKIATNKRKEYKKCQPLNANRERTITKELVCCVFRANNV